MKPITFACQATLGIASEEIARQILDITKWPEFGGYGPLPGIKVAEFEVQTPEIVGSKIRVENRDGSSHVEEIVEWEPKRRLRLHFHDFSAPLNRLATEFFETWEFENSSDSTRVIRTFELHARSAMTRPLLWVISLLLKKAIARHLSLMRNN